MSQVTNDQGVRVLIPTEDIARRRGELAAEISRDYAGEEVLLVCILKGSMVFFVDLAREIEIPVRFDHLGVSSYGEGSESSGEHRVTTDLSESIEGKHVLLVEDIVDTGRTVDFLMRRLGDQGATSLSVVALLDKPSRREVDVDVAYCGFTIPNEFVVGYGLDHAQRFRNLPYIGVLDEVE